MMRYGEFFLFLLFSLQLFHRLERERENFVQRSVKISTGSGKIPFSTDWKSFVVVQKLIICENMFNSFFFIHWKGCAMCSVLSANMFHDKIISVESNFYFPLLNKLSHFSVDSDGSTHQVSDNCLLNFRAHRLPGKE